MTFLPHGIGIGLSKEIDLADWARIRQGNAQIALERENLNLSKMREQRLLDEAERAKRDADWQYYQESIERPGQILSPRLEEDYVRTIFEPTITEMGQMWTTNMGIRDKTDYKALTEFEKKSNLLMNNQILADANYMQKQKDAYEAYKIKNGQDEYTRQFETELNNFENRITNTVPTFMPYKFDPIALVNSVKDNIAVDYKKGQRVGDYIEMEGVYNPDALKTAAKQIYNKDPQGWTNYFKNDPYLQATPEEAVAAKIEQMTALESKWLPAYSSSGGSSTTKKTPMRNMLLDFITNSEFYNNRKQQASKTAILAPHADMESFDGQKMPHLTVTAGNNVFTVEVPENSPVNPGQVMQLELPTNLNYRIISGNGLRFYDGSESGMLPETQNIYTSIRVEVYDPTSTQTATGGVNVGKATDPVADFINSAKAIGLNPTMKEYTIGTGSPLPGIGGTRQIKSTVIDLIVPIDWSNASAFNEQFMTQTQAAEVNTAFGAITEQNFDLPVIGIMTDANVDYEIAGTFLASYASAKGLTDMQAAATEFRKEFKQYNDSQPAGKKLTFDEYFAKKMQ